MVRAAPGVPWWSGLFYIFIAPPPPVLRGDSMYHSLSNAPHSIDVTKINSTTDDDSGLAQIAGVGHMAGIIQIAMELRNTIDLSNSS